MEPTTKVFLRIPPHQPRAWLRLLFYVAVQPRVFRTHLDSLSQADANTLAQYAVAPALFLLYLPTLCLVILADLLGTARAELNSKPSYLRSWLTDTAKWVSDNPLLILMSICAIWIVSSAFLYRSHSGWQVSHPVICGLFSYVASFALFGFFSIIVSPLIASLLIVNVWQAVVLGLVIGASTSVTYTISQQAGRYAINHWTAVALGLGASTTIGLVTVASPSTNYSLDGVRFYTILYFTLVGVGIVLWHRVGKLLPSIVV